MMMCHEKGCKKDWQHGTEWTDEDEYNFCDFLSELKKKKNPKKKKKKGLAGWVPSYAGEGSRMRPFELSSEWSEEGPCRHGGLWMGAESSQREQHGSIPDVARPGGQHGWVYAQLHLCTLWFTYILKTLHGYHVSLVYWKFLEYKNQISYIFKITHHDTFNSARNWTDS